jgi:hypothetical protein
MGVGFVVWSRLQVGLEMRNFQGRMAGSHEMRGAELVLGVPETVKQMFGPHGGERNARKMYIFILQNLIYLIYFKVGLFEDMADRERLCGLVVRVPGYKSRVPGFDPWRYQAI